MIPPDLVRTSTKVRAEFDRLALLDDRGDDHNAAYHDFLLRQIPAGCTRAIEIGCGTGAFSRKLANELTRRGAPLRVRVSAIDLSPVMIRIARERSAGIEILEFREQDVLDVPPQPESCDFLVSIATLSTTFHSSRRCASSPHRCAAAGCSRSSTYGRRRGSGTSRSISSPCPPRRSGSFAAPDDCAPMRTFAPHGRSTAGANAT